MHIRVLSFGVLKDWFGASPASIELPDGASVADLLRHLGAGNPSRSLRGIAVSVNAEYATASHILQDGDEIGLLPPVSGGAPLAASLADGDLDGAGVAVALTRAPIDPMKLAAAAKRGEDGALVVFDGVVRNQTHGRRTLFLDYEAYEQMALKQLKELAGSALARFDVRRVTVVHRLGRLQIGETSVFVLVASAHRAAAFDACRWIIDTLKQTVPIWKKETFVDGAVWAPGEPFPTALTVAPESAHEA